MHHLALLSTLMIFGGASAASAAAAAPAAVVRTPIAKTTSMGGPCQRSNVILAQSREAPRADKLAELPPGDLVLTVVREEDGCRKPVIVRYGIGSNSSPPLRRR